MNINFKGLGSAALASGVGVIVLLGYFFPLPLLVVLRDYFLQVAVLLAAIAVLVGVANLLSVHGRKLREVRKGGLYSAVLIIAFLATAIIGGWDYFSGVFGDAQNSGLMYVFRYIQVPVETSLMAILAIALAYAAARMLRWRATLATVLFLLAAVLTLIGSGMEIPYISDLVQPWLANVWAVAGARGLLLGIALGTIATGVRILTASDRPYGA